MRYAKLNSGTLEYAPRTVTVGRTHYNPTPDFYLESNGYLPLVETSYPNDGKYYIASWEQQGNKIIRVWIETDPPYEELNIGG